MLSEKFKNLVGKSIVKVIAGGSNGSIIVFDIGDDNYCLFIYCSWRLSEGNKVLASWNDDSDSLNGKLTLQIKSLNDDLITDAVLKSLYDFSLIFKSGKILDVFADITPNDDGNDENWSLADKQTDTSFNVSSEYLVKVSKYF